MEKDRQDPLVLDGWKKHGEMLLCVAIVLMAIAAVVWLGYEFGRLLFDLKLRHQEAESWFRGRPV